MLRSTDLLDRDVEFGLADVVLVGILAVMVAAWGVGLLTSVSMAAALGVGSVPASGAIGYVLFWNPPA